VCNSQMSRLDLRIESPSQNTQLAALMLDGKSEANVHKVQNILNLYLPSHRWIEY